MLLDQLRSDNRFISCFRYLSAFGKHLSATASTSDIASCAVLHPMQDSCAKNSLRVWATAGQKVLPLYLSLTFAPMVVLRTTSLIRNPIGNILWGVLSASRSAAFLASFVGGYQAAICLWGALRFPTHRIMFWVAGPFLFIIPACINIGANKL